MFEGGGRKGGGQKGGEKRQRRCKYESDLIELKVARSAEAKGQNVQGFAALYRRRLAYCTL